MTSEYLPVLAQELMVNTGLLENEEEYFGNFPHDDHGPTIENSVSFDFSGGSCSRTAQLFGSELDHTSLCDHPDSLFASGIGLDADAPHGLSGRELGSVCHSPTWSAAKDSYTFDLYQQRETQRTVWPTPDSGLSGDSSETNLASLSKSDSEQWQQGCGAFRGDSLASDYYSASKFGDWYCEESAQSTTPNFPASSMHHESRDEIHSRSVTDHFPPAKTNAVVSEASKSSQALDVPVLLAARYTYSDSSRIDPSGEGIVMSACKKEWLDKLNLPQRDVLRGQVQAVGELRTNDQGIARKLMVVEPKQHSVPIIHSLLRVTMSELASTAAKQRHPNPAPLGRPCFSPFVPGAAGSSLKVSIESPR